MAILLFVKIFIGFAFSIVVGGLIIAYPTYLERPRTPRILARSTAICLLLAGFMGFGALRASMGSEAAVGSMTRSYELFFASMTFTAASFAFGLSALVGAVELRKR